MEFDEKGNLDFQVISEEGDYLFDEIGSVLKDQGNTRRQRRELLEALELILQDLLSGGKCRLGRGKRRSGRRRKGRNR